MFGPKLQWMTRFAAFPRFTVVGTKKAGRSHDPRLRPGGAPAPGEPKNGLNVAKTRYPPKMGSVAILAQVRNYLSDRSL